MVVSYSKKTLHSKIVGFLLGNTLAMLVDEDPRSKWRS